MISDEPVLEAFTQYLLHNIYSATIFTHTWTEDEPTRLPVSIWTQEKLFTCFNLDSKTVSIWTQEKDLFHLELQHLLTKGPVSIGHI